jgi:D-glycero-alpha-D-manno-heptose-7-phosphate kinase
MNEGVEIHHVADLPARTGLGKSSAFTVGLLGLYALREQTRDKQTLEAEAIHVEQQSLQEAVGAQDQVCAENEEFNCINFQTDGSIDVKRILTWKDQIAEVEHILSC